MVGLAPGVDASALAETGAVLESGDDFDGPLVVVEENGFGRVEMDVLEVHAALAVAIVAVRVDVVWGEEEKRVLIRVEVRPKESAMEAATEVKGPSSMGRIDGKRVSITVFLKMLRERGGGKQTC